MSIHLITTQQSARDVVVRTARYLPAERWRGGGEEEEEEWKKSRETKRGREKK